MSQFKTWTVEQLDAEISSVAKYRDACRSGAWGERNRDRAEGYQDRIDSMTFARNEKLKERQ